MLRRHFVNVQTQVESSVEKTLCCWLCTSGPISITSRTDRRGYCPGKLHDEFCVRVINRVETGITLAYNAYNSLYSQHAVCHENQEIENPHKNRGFSLSQRVGRAKYQKPFRARRST